MQQLGLPFCFRIYGGLFGEDARQELISPHLCERLMHAGDMVVAQDQGDYVIGERRSDNGLKELAVMNRAEVEANHAEMLVDLDEYGGMIGIGICTDMLQEQLAAMSDSE